MFRINLIITALCCWVNTNGATFGNKSTSVYDPGELLAQIFSGNNTQLRANNGFIKFDDQFDSDFVSFEGQHSNPTLSQNVKFNNEQTTNSLETNQDFQFGTVKFEDSIQAPSNGHNGLDNGLDPNANKNNGGQKKRRRRRKPKQFPGQPGYPYPGSPGPIPPGPANFPTNTYFQPGFNGQSYRPPRRPRPSVASDAVSAVTGALTSIALNDDYQCVARLLCEAAAGGALGGSSLLQSVAGLEPLLTLLSAYNGISSNPLFVFGRAAFLGMSSKGNPGSCRYAYPLCPTDPEQLVHYLNNHNGGFFRFFNSPQTGQQNLEQFYNQLSQNYGLYQPGTNQGQYGFLNQGQIPNVPNGPYNQEHYGFLQGQVPNYGAQKPNLYPNGYGYQNYGFAFPYNQNYNAPNGVRFKNDKRGIDNDGRIQKRIQNKPADFVDDNNEEKGSKWLFPGDDDEYAGVHNVNYNDFKADDDDYYYRKEKTLRFPDTAPIYNSNVQEYNRRPKDTYNTYDREIYRHPKDISFPGTQNNRNVYNDYVTNYPSYNNHQYYNNVGNNVHNANNVYNDEPGVQTVYVVRGNGDPNKPEVVKLRPGEKLI